MWQGLEPYLGELGSSGASKGFVLPPPKIPGCTHISLFQGAKETVASSARTQPSSAVPMEENSLYSSWQDCMCRDGEQGWGGLQLSAAVLTPGLFGSYSD